MFLCVVIELVVQSDVVTKETKLEVNFTLFFVGLLSGNSVTSALEGSRSMAAAVGAQSSPSRVTVTGLDRSRVKLPPKPSSHDWCPEEPSGTNMEEVVQVCNCC